MAGRRPRSLARAGCLLLLGSLGAAAAAPVTVIRNVNLVTMDVPGVLTGRAVVVRDGEIEGIVRDADAAGLPGALTIDAGGGYLVPGLVDAHVHHGEEVDYPNYLAWGVTTVLGLGQRSGIDDFLAVRAAIAAGELAGPAIYTTGASIAAHVDIDDPGAARDYVAAAARAGWPYVKVYNEIPQPVFDAVVAEARARGLGVFGHIPRNFPTEYALANGLDVVAHAEEFYFAYFGGPRDRDLDAFDGTQLPDLALAAPVIELMLEHEVALIPNLVFTFDQMRFWQDEDAVLGDPETAYLHPDIRAGWRRSHSAMRPNPRKRMLRERIKYGLIHEFTRRAHAAGVLVVTGTDTPLPGLFPGKSLHAEMRELVKSGLDYAEVLAAATANGGELLRRYVDADARIGRIAPGYQADLVLVHENPLDDIRRMSHIAAVMSDGRWYTRAELDRLRAGIADGYR